MTQYDRWVLTTAWNLSSDFYEGCSGWTGVQTLLPYGTGTPPYFFLHTTQPVYMSYNQKVKCSRSILPNLLPFLGIAMKEPRLPPMTLWGLRSGGFLKEPVYWWRKECMLWDVGGLPFFTIGSVVHGIQESFHGHRQSQDRMRRVKKTKQSKSCNRDHLQGSSLLWLFIQGDRV